VVKCINNLKNKAELDTQKGASLGQKMRQNAFGGQALPGPAGGA